MVGILFGIGNLLYRLSQLMHLTRVRTVTLILTILTATLHTSYCEETPTIDVQQNEMDYDAADFAAHNSNNNIPPIGEVKFSEKPPLTTSLSWPSPIFVPTSLLSNLVTSSNNRNSNNDKDTSAHILENIPSSSAAKNQRNNRQSDKSTTQLSSRIIHTRNGAISGVIVRLDARYLDPVEAFRGIPYASPPVGNLRFMPPVSAAQWPGVKKAKSFGPVCPQRLPDVSNETASLEHMPKGRLEYLKRLIPYLQNQSEDCLYLNIYVPIQVASREGQNSNSNGSSGTESGKTSYPGNQSKYAVIVFVHGESYEWNSGNPYEGSVLASYGQVLVVTINYRLGILGFMNANTDRYTKLPANYGLMDIIAALHWLRENIAAFGGDPNNITLAGHGTGAACVHFLMSSMAVPEGSLFNRAILMSGSGLTPWSIVKNPAKAAAEVANYLNCASNLPQVHLMKCLREKSVEDLLSVSIREPEFGFTFGPTIDGVVIDGGDVALPLSWQNAAPQYYNDERNEASAEDIAQAVSENTLLMRKTALNKLSRYDVMAGVTRAEAFLKFNSADVQYGFEADRRSQILKAFIHDTYTYHLNEIYATIVNEYTDWERPVQHPINIRDETLEALGDAQVVAAAVRTMDLHSSAHRNSYFYVFDYQTRYGDYPQRQGCIHGEDLPYVFGAPLVGGFNHFSKNFTKAEINLSEIVMMYWANFARTGNPNEQIEIGTRQDRNRLKQVEWTAYESNHKKYLNFDIKPKLKSHFRAHRLSFWLNLVPELHKQGGDNVPEQHHQLNVKEDDTYNSKRKNPSYSSQAGVTALSNFSLFTNQVFSLLNYSSPALQRNKTYYSADDHSIENLDSNDGHDSSMGSFDNDGFAAYSTALSATIAIGCSLLILNVLIFAGVYYQRDKIRLSEARTQTKDKKQENVQVLNNICGDIETSNLHTKNDAATMLPKHHAVLHHQMTPTDFADIPYRVPAPPKHANDISPMMTAQCAVKKSCMKQQLHTQTSLSHIGHQTAKSATIGGLNVCSSASTLSGDCTQQHAHGQNAQCLNPTSYSAQAMGLMDELCV